MVLSVVQFRKNIYKLIYRVATSGVPIDLKYKGKILRIISLGAASKLDNLKERPCIVGDPYELVAHDWSGVM
jgi:hypothetical protein